MKKFAARYKDDKIEKTIIFANGETQEDAEKILKAKGIKNFIFFMEPYAPIPINENGMLFRGEVGFDITAENIMEQIRAGKDIVLNSYGGELFEGWRIHDTIKLSGLKVDIGILGVCASSATIILLAGETRWSSENSRLLIHNPWNMAVGDDEEFEKMGKTLKVERLVLAEKYSEISGKPIEEIISLMKDERWLTPKEMQSFNFINEVKPIKNENEMNTKEVTEKLSVLETMMNKVMNLIKPQQAKNIIITDANGLSIEFPNIDDESQIEIGEVATVDGTAADGEYVVQGGIHDGKTFIFAAGILTEIKEVGEAVEETTEEETAPDVEAQIEALKVENNALKQKALRLEKANKAAMADISKMKAELTSFRAEVTSGIVDETASPETQTETKAKFSYRKGSIAKK